MKSKKLISLGVMLSASVIFASGCGSMAAHGLKENQFYVDFYSNYLREDFVLSNGTIAKGNNIIYKTIEVDKDSLITKPEDPSRKNYDFIGWFTEEEGVNEWNFATQRVIRNTRLFAKWEYTHEEVEPEPEYTPPSTLLDESAEVDYVIDSVMYFKVNYNIVNLPTAAISKLEAFKEDVLPYMEYRVKATKTISATYDNNKITVKCGDEEQVITVKDASLDYVLGNSTYETKAKNYEKNAVIEENYHVMLAGSSSIEFWTTSKEDMDPIVSYNHGIGGTTIEEWDECLNQRLVLPYKPKMVAYYVGINNVINSKETADVIYNKLEKFMNDTHEALPDTKVQYIMMNLIPGYPAYYDVINSVNERITTYQKSHSSWLTLINPGTALLKKNGIPNAAYFRTDGLHLSLYGYVVWGGIVKKSIVEGLERL